MPSCDREYAVNAWCEQGLTFCQQAQPFLIARSRGSLGLKGFRRKARESSVHSIGP